MLGRQPSGFNVSQGMWLDRDDAAVHAGLPRTCARCPASLKRPAYDPETATVTISLCAVMPPSAKQ